MDREAWHTAVHGVTKELDRIEQLNWTELMNLWKFIIHYILWVFEHLHTKSFRIPKEKKSKLELRPGWRLFISEGVELECKKFSCDFWKKKKKSKDKRKEKRGHLTKSYFKARNNTYLDSCLALYSSLTWLGNGHCKLVPTVNGMKYIENHRQQCKRSFLKTLFKKKKQNTTLFPLPLAT